MDRALSEKKNCQNTGHEDPAFLHFHQRSTPKRKYVVITQ